MGTPTPSYPYEKSAEDRLSDVLMELAGISGVARAVADPAWGLKSLAGDTLRSVFVPNVIRALRVSGDAWAIGAAAELEAMLAARLEEKGADS